MHSRNKTRLPYSFLLTCWTYIWQDLRLNWCYQTIFHKIFLVCNIKCLDIPYLTKIGFVLKVLFCVAGSHAGRALRDSLARSDRVQDLLPSRKRNNCPQNCSKGTGLILYLKHITVSYWYGKATNFGNWFYGSARGHKQSIINY